MLLTLPVGLSWASRTYAAGLWETGHLTRHLIGPAGLKHLSGMTGAMEICVDHYDCRGWRRSRNGRGGGRSRTAAAGNSPKIAWVKNNVVVKGNNPDQATIIAKYRLCGEGVEPPRGR